MNIEAYRGLEPHHVWQHFAALNSIPRPSGREAAAIDYVRQVAEQAGATSVTDAKGNIVVRVPARGDASPDAPLIALQSHLDMVCEKRPDVQHDFDTDPIRPRRDGDRIFATGTTLGADNGIGAAAALAVLTHPGLSHGPLELLFTVEEETGLYGALELDPGLLQATTLLNLDSADPAEIIIGCVGGAGTSLSLPRTPEATPTAWSTHERSTFELTLSGLKGGHSGVQIHEPLANAIKVLTGVLLNARKNNIKFQLVSFDGGTAHNAIPRDARAVIAVAPDAVEALEAWLQEARGVLHARWEKDEPNLALELRSIETTAPEMSQHDAGVLLQLLDALPHGALAFSPDFPDKVQTSTNLCSVKTETDSVQIDTSSRSLLVEELQALQEQIQTLGREANATFSVRDGYPGWEPNPDSLLLHLALPVYEAVYGKPARIEVIHGGLECGVIASKKPNLDAISFGPLIQGAHTPEESVSISTVQTTWQFLTQLLAVLGRS